MSLANKLYKIGKSITDKKTIESLIRREPDSSKDYQTVAIDFSLKKGIMEYSNISNDSCQNSFYSERLGGSSSAIFYLYPNLIVHNEVLINAKIKGKFSQLIATLENILTYQYANEKNSIFLQFILENIKDKKIIDKLKNYLKGDYLYLITINNKSLFEVMPEIWDNWFENPAIPYKDLEPKYFYDYISDEESLVGYNTDIGCCTVNNYNDKLKHRIIDNIPLSKESARYIKFGWLYTKKYLLFYFDGMQFMIIPSYAKENAQEFKDIISKLKTANENTNVKRNTLKILANEEADIKKIITKLEKLKKKDEQKIKETKEELEEKRKMKSNLTSKIADGLFTNFKDDIKYLEFIQGLTVDIIFIELNKNEVKIFGSLEEILPSKILKIVTKMNEYNINDQITLANKDYTQTYLHDFFHRDELYFYKMNKRKNDPKNTSYRAKILSERFYLAKLLLGDNKISSRELYKRFEFNAEYDYEHKKRFNDKMIKVWIDNGQRGSKDENNILAFFNDKEINKIKD